MKIQPVGFATFAGILVLLSVVRAAPTESWSPNKALLGKLAPAITTATGVHQIQPPKGYLLQSRTGPGGSSGQAWVGEPRPDGTRSWVMLVVLTPPAGEENKYTLAQVSARMLAGVQQQRKNWKQEPAETGTVNGITFIRTYWQGNDAVMGVPMRGFSYVAQEGKTFLQLASQDVEPYAKTSLPLAEASVLTFKRLVNKTTDTAGSETTKPR